jgi:UDP:flavonoid glycosyltransferase YjiC (YdhE family)
VRLPTYSFEDHELLDAVERMVAATDLEARMRLIANRIQGSPGPVRAADLIERLVETGAPVIR